MMTDTQLLDRYVLDRDPDAFRGIVLRHGPAVLRECRRIVRENTAAEDAFQATFLVLVRKAHTLEDPSRLQGWLVGVARRIAFRARQDSARRHEREGGSIAVEPAAEESRDMLAPDALAIVRQEIGGLPERYRDPVQLCYVEGLSHEDAALALGCPLGTVKARLVRGRRRLRERLERRGLALGLAMLLLLRSPGRSDASPSAGLIDRTVDAMNLARDGSPASLTRKYARAVRLARGWKASHPSYAAALAALAIFAFGGAALAACSLAAEVERPEPAALPTNLTDILAIDCR
ncbi:MAG: RNA polymerase sigma factor [Isosphaeraceae bacterium]